MLVRRIKQQEAQNEKLHGDIRLIAAEVGLNALVLAESYSRALYGLRLLFSRVPVVPRRYNTCCNCGSRLQYQQRSGDSIKIIIILQAQPPSLPLHL